MLGSSSRKIRMVSGIHVNSWPVRKPMVKHGLAGILVERLVKALRYVPDVRRCQYVVQRPKGVRRRQRLNVEYVDGRAGGPSVSTEAARCASRTNWHAVGG